jgi:hypothetical protein
MALGDGRSAFSSFWFDFSFGRQLAALAQAGIAVAEADIILDVLAAVAEPVEPHFLWR